MKILVTGAAGFIGSHCCEKLHELGHEVIGVDNFNPYYNVNLKRLNGSVLQKKGIEILETDLRDPDLIKNLPTDIDYIFHFAAQPGISATSSFEAYLTNNVIATKNLIDYALQISQLKLFVNISTSSVYGIDATYSEDRVPKPISYYGITKLAAEQLVLAASREEKVKACSLRLYSVYGPRERPEKLYTKLISCGFSDEAFTLYRRSAHHRRSFTYVGDIVDGVVSVMGRETVVNGEIINLGTEAEYTTQEGINSVEKVMDKNIQITYVPPRSGDQLRTKAVIDKARELLNYEPETTLMEGVKKQVSWYRENFV